MNGADAASFSPPSLPEIREALLRLRPFIIETPIVDWSIGSCGRLPGMPRRVVAKLELLQRAGSFKVRAALLNTLSLDAAALERGITTVSSGNHAVATATAAREIGTSAKVVMLQSANPARIELCHVQGAEVLFADDGVSAFGLATRLASDEGRTFLHPYDGMGTIAGTSTLGMEFYEQAGQLDAVVIPVGGGGLCAGMAAAICQCNPQCLVFGVEPDGADVMRRSFAAGGPTGISSIQTIADSLGAPFTTPMTYALCRDFVDELCVVTEDEIRAAMSLIFRELKFAVEPAAAVSTAALLGPLRGRLDDLSVGIVLCGSNIDIETYIRVSRP